MFYLEIGGVFILGLIFGSFLNLVSYRLIRQQSILFPHSYCDSCQEPLSWFDLIPVFGYLSTKGKCRHCGKLIAWHYPLIEILLGLLWAMLFWRFGFSWYTLGGLIFSFLLLVCALTDGDSGMIFNRVTYPGILLGLLFSLLQGKIALAFGGMLLLGVAFGLVLLLSRGGMGGGDLKMALMIGAFCGTQGAFLTFVLSSLSGFIYVVYLFLRRRAKRKLEIRFGIFLSGGSYLAYLYGTELLELYLSILAR